MMNPKSDRDTGLGDTGEDMSSDWTLSTVEGITGESCGQPWSPCNERHCFEKNGSYYE